MADNWQDLFARVRSALMRRGRSSHDADDLVQESWLRLEVYRRQEPVAEPEAFLMRIALNLSIDVHRRQLAHGEEVSIDEVVLVDPRPGAEDVVLSRERVARLAVALARLTDRRRDIFMAHCVDGMSYREIARARNISTSTVETHMAKATEHVMGWMEGW